MSDNEALLKALAQLPVYVSADGKGVWTDDKDQEHTIPADLARLLCDLCRHGELMADNERPGWTCVQCDVRNSDRFAMCVRCSAERVNARGQTWTEFCAETAAESARVDKKLGGIWVCSRCEQWTGTDLGNCSGCGKQRVRETTIAAAELEREVMN